jgi:hypothetical protein
MKTNLKITKMVSVSCMILFGMFLTACGGGGGTTAPPYTRSWIHPADLADNISPDGQDAYIVCSPQVAMDDNGDAIITWEQSDGSNWQIFKSEYR